MTPNRCLRPILVVSLAVFLLAGCGEDEPPAPTAQEITRDAIGHYCNMIVVDHLGPKGQIHLKSGEEPIWFSSVRDTIAFTMLPEEPKDIAAIYVNDMARASWGTPEPDTWIDAREAWYVVGSRRVGGMGAPEAVPFSEEDAARAFAAEFGGDLVAFADIPESFILGAVETPPDDAMSHADHTAPMQTMSSDHADTHASHDVTRSDMHDHGDHTH